MCFREALRAKGVCPLIKHRVFASFTRTTRASRPNATTSVRSVIKRSYGSAIRARAWYRQFREISLTAAVYNVEQAVKP
jgi:hypothetical protein